jgi:hypothetical protein
VGHFPPIMQAVSMKQLQVVKMLLKYGADPNIQDG